MKNRSLYSRDEMLKMNVETLEKRGIMVKEIAAIKMV